MDGIFILSLRRSARYSRGGSGRDERGMGKGRDETAGDEIEGGFHPYGLTQRESGMRPDVFALRYAFIYLPERLNSQNDADILSVERGRKKLFFYNVN